WTDNGEAEPGSVRRMLDHYLGEEEARGGLYFGGHRPVSDGYLLRADGRYVQIHDPQRFVVAHLPATGPIDLERDVREIDSRWLLSI
ncbi:MAG TPA: calcineurin, partial [Spirochaetia bacterium]|nr:calcineurin [Spirochaetia bacterium]